MRRLLVAFAATLALAACGPHAKAPGADPASEAAGKAFLAKNAKAPGVVVLPSGLQYRVVRSGPAGAPSPHLRDEIKINYEGTLQDGTVFDSTFQRGAPAVMPLDHLVPGWMEALPKMHVGDEWYLYVPPALGYGAEGAGGVIPPNAVLVFRVQLLGVLPAGGSGPASA
jgi:peptidylprolyl isomerase/FKBP-type peptidyl-prolyl cis-trans isomerase FklB